MTNYFTGGGDKGMTNIANDRMRKDEPLIQAIGDIDELNSSIGVALFYVHDDDIRGKLKAIQNELFLLGANLAAAKPVDAKRYAKEIKSLEDSIKDLGRKLPDLRKFVLPGGCEGAVHLHMSRAIARRLERQMVTLSMKQDVDPILVSYTNRLSSVLFVMAIYLNHSEGVQEENPTY